MQSADQLVKVIKKFEVSLNFSVDNFWSCPDSATTNWLFMGINNLARGHNPMQSHPSLGCLCSTTEPKCLSHPKENLLKIHGVKIHCKVYYRINSFSSQSHKTFTATHTQ